MKTIGLIGGMSWESTALYYQKINDGVKQRLGGLHSAKLVLFSVNFQEIEALQAAGEWEKAGAILAAAARSLKAAGADFLVLCTNTMHKVVPAIRAAVDIPLLHIADATATAIAQNGIRTIGLLGTRFTMEQDFYRGRLEAAQNLQVLVPDPADRETVHHIIYQELCLGIVREESRLAYRQVIERLIARGAQGIILGCTEIGMLVSSSDSPVPVFDTTAIHAASAVDFALR